MLQVWADTSCMKRQKWQFKINRLLHELQQLLLIFEINLENTDKNTAVFASRRTNKTLAILSYVRIVTWKSKKNQKQAAIEKK